MIDKKTLNDILRLCRMDISSEEKEHFQTQIGDILEYFNLLNSVDTKDVDLDWDIAITKDELREDIPGKSLTGEEIMELSTNFQDGFFIVPQVLDNTSGYNA